MSTSPLRCLSLGLVLLLAACGDSSTSAPDTGRARPDAALDADLDFPAPDAARADAATTPADAALAADAALEGGDATSGEDATAAGEDASVAGDDAGAAGEDAAAPGPDAAAAGPDAAQPGADAAAPGPDAGSQPRPLGQCATDSQCPSGYTCVASAPGGLCNGCMGSCGVSGPYECAYGGCSRTCEDDGDCPAGLRCATTAGLCALITCGCPTCGTCPAPYVCEGGLCRRPPCPNGVGDCPAGWGCAKGYCDEP